ncbi:MAG: cysteine desulfurase [Dehalococcoidia bacterium SG8_51_3]|nr:MAG: cysteine desulfurase [Dehalococcoidia bacterium SG8_51_3]
MQRIYLDYAATTPTHPNVVEAMLPYFTNSFGNPSSIYACGQDAKEATEGARANVAALIGARDEEIIFTSGGTEADNAALKGVAYASKDKGHIITSSIEHHAILETGHFLETQGFEITYLPVDEHGMVDPDDVRRAITDKTVIVSIMHANNEVGTIQPIAEIGRITREAGAYLHTDAVQSAGHVPLNVDELGVDLLSMSAHKLYGPKGVGALYVRKGTKLVSFMHGGEQEYGRRAGTHNVPGIVGLGKAAQIAQHEIDEEAERVTRLRDKLLNGIQESIDHVRINGHPQMRLPNNLNVSISYAEGEAMCLKLDREGICCSTGSACTSADTSPSHVLTALGLDPLQAHSSLRFSLGKWTTEEEIDRMLNTLPRIVANLRAMSPLLKSHG